jgi:hypothetical protein
VRKPTSRVTSVEIFAHIKCYAAMVGSKLVTFWNKLSVPSARFFLDCLTLEDGTDGQSRNVGNYQPTLRNIPEKRLSLCTVFVLNCTVVVLYCFVMCVCTRMCGFCNVCVWVLVICILYPD